MRQKSNMNIKIAKKITTLLNSSKIKFFHLLSYYRLQGETKDKMNRQTINFGALILERRLLGAQNCTFSCFMSRGID